MGAREPAALFAGPAPQNQAQTEHCFFEEEHPRLRTEPSIQAQIEMTGQL
jgi:hypothetical protein